MKYFLNLIEIQICLVSGFIYLFLFKYISIYIYFLYFYEHLLYVRHYAKNLGSLGCYNKIPALEVGGWGGCSRSGASRFDVR